MPTPFDVIKEEYVTLRSEISQSISFQHRILIAGYGASGAVVGVLASTSHISWIGLMIVPFVFLAMISLWTVECNRMVRASYYIGAVLWPEFRESADYSGTADWERWIRGVQGMPGDFGDIQDRQQQLAVWIIPAIISIFCAGTALTRAASINYSTQLFVSTIIVTQLILWRKLLRRVRRVSRLANTPIPETGPIGDHAISTGLPGDRTVYKLSERWADEQNDASRPARTSVIQEAAARVSGEHNTNAGGGDVII